MDVMDVCTQFLFPLEFGLVSLWSFPPSVPGFSLHLICFLFITLFQGLSTLVQLILGVGEFFVVRGMCWELQDILQHSWSPPTDANSIIPSPVMTIKNSSVIAKCSLRDKITPSG